MNKALSIVGYILMGVTILVVADMISGAVERARQKRVAAAAATETAQ